MTVEDLKLQLAKEALTLSFDIHFLPGQDSVVLLAKGFRHGDSLNEIEDLLQTIKPRIQSSLLDQQLVQSCHLCAFNMVESTGSPSVDFIEPVTQHSTTGTASGWSQIASRKAASAKAAPVKSAVGERPIYTVLGSKLAEAKKKKQEEEV